MECFEPFITPALTSFICSVLQVNFLTGESVLWSYTSAGIGRSEVSECFTALDSWLGPELRMHPSVDGHMTQTVIQLNKSKLSVVPHSYSPSIEIQKYYFIWVSPLLVPWLFNLLPHCQAHELTSLYLFTSFFFFAFMFHFLFLEIFSWGYIYVSSK